MEVKKPRHSVAARMFWTLFDKEAGGWPFDAICARAQGCVGKRMVSADCYNSRVPDMNAVVVKSVEVIDLDGKVYGASGNDRRMPRVLFRCMPEDAKERGGYVWKWGEVMDAAHLYDNVEDAMKDLKHNEGVVASAFFGTVYWLNKNFDNVQESLKSYAEWERFLGRHGYEIKRETRDAVERIRRAVAAYESEVAK